MCKSVFIILAYFCSVSWQLTLQRQAYFSSILSATTLSATTILQALQPDAEYDYCEAAQPTPHSYAPLKEAKLLKVQAVIRHGDRTPLITLDGQDETWSCLDIKSLGQTKLASGVRSARTETVVEIPSNYPFKDALWNGTCDLGQLTPKGAAQHIRLGRALKSIYQDQLNFLPNKLDSLAQAEKSVYVRSTDYPRTKQSASFVLSGLYPTHHHHHHQQDLSKHPESNKKFFKIHVYPSKIDTMNPNAITNSGYCPRLNQLLSDLPRNEEMAKFFNSTQPFRKHLKDILAPNDQVKFNDVSMNDFFDALMPRYCHALPPPCNQDGQCVSDQDLAQLGELSNKEYEIRYGALNISQSLNQLEIGLFLKELSDSLATPVKFELYSGHDTTLYNLLGLLRSKELRWPPYASNLLIEYWKSSSLENKTLVRIIFNGQALQTDWCDFERGCELETFTKYIDDQVPRDFIKACTAVA